MASGATTRCAWPGRGESVSGTNAVHELPRPLVHLLYWTFIRRWISMGFTTSLLKKTDDRKLFFFGACCKCSCHLYTTTAPSCCIPTSYCHLSDTLQTIGIIVANLQDNRAVFQIVIALLRFSFDSPSYVWEIPELIAGNKPPLTVWRRNYSF